MLKRNNPNIDENTPSKRRKEEEPPENTEIEDIGIDDDDPSSQRTLLNESKQLQDELEASLSKEDFNKVLQLLETERELTLMEEDPF